MKKCPYCGHENNEQDKVCEKCYAALRDETPGRPEKAKKKTYKE